MIQRRTSIRRINPERAAERREYNKRKAAYLAEHPFDQVAIAFHGLDEATVIRAGAGRNFVELSVAYGHVARIERADQIHHRNKAHHTRLNDERWWMSTNWESHQFLENNKRLAREFGFLLPIQADAEGRWGSDNQGLTTPELMKAKQKR